MGNIGKTLHEGLRELQGRDLSSVEFVMDYVQFYFGGPCLTAHIPPSVTTALGHTLVPDKQCYRDALCERIGVKVRDTEADATGVAINFEDGAIFRISLREQDYRGPEALEFVNESGDIWVT